MEAPGAGHAPSPLSGSIAVVSSIARRTPLRPGTPCASGTFSASSVTPFSARFSSASRLPGSSVSTCSTGNVASKTNRAKEMYRAICGAGAGPELGGQRVYLTHYYQPLLQFLRRESAPPTPPFRTEIPFTRFHWEAYVVAKSLPAGAGLERQLDIANNSIFSSLPPDREQPTSTGCTRTRSGSWRGLMPSSTIRRGGDGVDPSAGRRTCTW